MSIGRDFVKIPLAIAGVFVSLFGVLCSLHAAQVNVDSAVNVCGHYHEKAAQFSSVKIKSRGPAGDFSDQYLDGIDAKSIDETRRYLSKLAATSQSLVRYDREDIAKNGSNNEYQRRLAYDQFVECMALQTLQTVSGNPASGPSGGSPVALHRPFAESQTGDKSQADQSLALAQQNQSRGDEQAKKDGRKRNDSAHEAHNCLTPVDLDNPRSFGSLRNSCGYKVEFHFCVLRPNASSWSTAYDCEKQSFGGGSAGAGGRGPVQIKGAQSVLWFACRSPAIVVDQRYDAAQGGLTGRCRVVGG